MLPEGMDESLLQEFLTESGELIEQLDTDLVELESDPSSSDLLDSIFRALHTIKGAASFLALTNLIEFAHAAEDALNKLRKGEVSVDQHVIDVMLKSVDIIRGQLDNISDGDDPAKGPDDLLNDLRAIADNTAPPNDSGNEPTATAGNDTPTVGPLNATATPIDLPPEKADVMPFMAEDLRNSLSQFREQAGKLSDATNTPAVSNQLIELVNSMAVVADFFEFSPLQSLLTIVEQAVTALGSISEELSPQMHARIAALTELLSYSADGIEAGCVYEWQTDTIAERIQNLSNNQPLEGDATVSEPTAEAALKADGLQPEEPETTAGITEDTTAASPERERKSGDKSVNSEATVRVEVGRLESLMNLVGEMVLTKNQVLGVSRQLGQLDLPQESLESIASTASNLDRLTSELQMAVMRTRMQPLNKLFGKYSRLIRDLARKTEKSIDLVITGGETEVDKSVLELLADPLVHIIRNSVDHGLEPPEARRAAGKPDTGTINVKAEHQGGHVCVQIIDNGRGINRAKVSEKAIEKGIATPEQIEAMSDREIYQFIFAAGFSTADEVSDLSGRGVGMDVVRTNVNKLGGSISVDATPGQGTHIEILIPLTVAILPAMMIGISGADYAIPIMTILEIVGLRDADLGSVSGHPVLRLREDVLPLINMRALLGECEQDLRTGFAVIVQIGQEKAGLMVDRLIGQREVVIKPLEDEYTVGGPFSGATIREDGDVSLILDVIQIVRDAKAPIQTPSQNAPVAA